MNRFGRLIVFSVLFAAFASSAGAQQLSLADLQSKMSGQWLATIAGESRTRTLDIGTVAQKGEGAYLFTGTYNFTGDKPSPAKAPEIQQSSEGIKLIFYSGADSLITATAQPDGTFAGTIQYKSGETKAIKLEKGAAPVAAASASAGTLSKADVQSLVAGKSLSITRLRDGDAIAWDLKSDGALYARNIDKQGSDSGTWEINDRGALCVTLRQSGSGCSVFRKSGDKYTMHSNPAAAAWGEVKGIR